MGMQGGGILRLIGTSFRRLHVPREQERSLATILIVDDIPAHRRLLMNLLGTAHHTMLEARNGAAALRSMDTTVPDLIITDVLMPVMDGYELVRRLRLDERTRNVPVLFFSAPYGEREARAKAKLSGIPFVLRKPARPEEVLEVVNRVLAGGLHVAELTAAVSPGTPADREYLHLISDELTDTSDHLRIANARLRALINIGLELSERRDTIELVEQVCTAAQDLFGSDYATLAIVDSEQNTIVRFVACGADTANFMAAGDPVPGILRCAVSNRRAFRGENVGGRPHTLELPAGHPEIRAYLVAPIASPLRAYGWICLVNNQGRAFSDEDEQLLMALAGQIGRVYEIDHEMAESKRTGAALRVERDRSQRYLDTAQVILLALDREGRILQINRYGCTSLGWAAADLIGESWIEKCTPVAGRSALHARFAEVIDGDLAVVEAPILCRSGEERLFEWRNTITRNEAGDVTGTFSSGADIAECTRATDAFRSSEARMRFVLNAAHVGIWDMDFTTGVLEWSDIMKSQYGIREGAFAGTFEAFVERIHPDDRATALEAMSAANRTGGDFNLIHRTLWPDGTVRWVSGVGRIELDSAGAPFHGVGISLDITDRHLLEEQYHQAEKMQAIGRLAGGVAHDFNNLLTAILGYCEMLLADLDPQGPPYADVLQIQGAGHAAAGLTRQLLAFSRKEIVAPTSIDLNAVVTEMHGILSRLIREDITMHVTLAPMLGCIRADRTQIEQVIVNLAVNAADAMPHGGKLSIETCDATIGEDFRRSHLDVAAGEYVAIKVRDTGTGMTADVLDKLFEPFFTTKDVGKGTGLGLSTVHGIVALNHGTIDVQTAVGQGTQFTIYFPRWADTGSKPSAVNTGAARRRVTETVLVVEDADGLGELTSRLLEHAGYSVLLARNSADATRIFAEEPTIDLLLTDVVMPGGSGPQLAALLREKRPGLRVVYMSGYTEDAIIQHGVVAPGISFLHKPFSSDALLRILDEVLGRDLETSGIVAGS